MRHAVLIRLILAFITMMFSITLAFADKYVVTANQLNVRDAPKRVGFVSNIIGKLKQGDLIDGNVTSDPDWIIVNTTSGGRGYVSARFLRKDNSFSREDNLQILPERSLPFLKDFLNFTKLKETNYSSGLLISDNGRYAIFLISLGNFKIYDLEHERIIFEKQSAGSVAVTNNYIFYSENDATFSYSLDGTNRLKKMNLYNLSAVAPIYDSDKILYRANPRENTYGNDEYGVFDVSINKTIRKLGPLNEELVTYKFHNANRDNIIIIGEKWDGSKNINFNLTVFNTRTNKISKKLREKKLEFMSGRISSIFMSEKSNEAIFILDRFSQDKGYRIVNYSLQTGAVNWFKDYKQFLKQPNIDHINSNTFQLSTHDGNIEIYNPQTGDLISRSKSKHVNGFKSIKSYSNGERYNVVLKNTSLENGAVKQYILTKKSWRNDDIKMIQLRSVSGEFVDITDGGLFRTLISDKSVGKQVLFEWNLQNSKPTLAQTISSNHIKWISKETDGGERSVLAAISRKPGRYSTYISRRESTDDKKYYFINKPPTKKSQFQTCYVGKSHSIRKVINSYSGNFVRMNDGCIIGMPEIYGQVAAPIYDFNASTKFKYNCVQNSLACTFAGVNMRTGNSNSLGHNPLTISNFTDWENKLVLSLDYRSDGVGKLKVYKSNANKKGRLVHTVDLDKLFRKNILKNYDNIFFDIINFKNSKIEISYYGVKKDYSNISKRNIVEYNFENKKKLNIKINGLNAGKIFYHKNNYFQIDSDASLFNTLVKIYDEKFNLTSTIDLKTSQSDIDDLNSRISTWENVLLHSVSATEHRVYGIDNGKLRATLHLDASGNTVAITPSGFFSENKPGAASSIIVLNKDTGEALPLSSVFDDLYRPDLVQEALRGDPDGKVKEATKKLNLASVVGSGAAPEIQKVEFDGDPKASSITAKYEAKIQDGGVGQVIWRLNGVVVGVEDISSVSSSGETIQGERRVPLVKGENVVSVQITNSKQSVYSEEVSNTIVADPKKDVKPQLFVLALGVNEYQAEELKLNFSVPDALAIVDSLAKKSDQYDEVIVHKLLDGEVTKEAIADKFAEISEAIEPDDTFVFYLAGHGITHEGKFYFLPADVDVKDGFETAIEKYGVSQNDWRTYLSGISALKSLVLFDACESGSAIRLDASHALEQSSSIDRLARASGRAIITASSETQYALEGYEGHGAFTYTLLQAFEEGDDNSDNQLQLSEIAKYVKRELPKITEEKWDYKQEPQVALSGADFPVAQVGQ